MTSFGWLQLSRNSVCIAAAEPFIWLASISNLRAFVANLYSRAGIIEKEYPEILLNFTQGSLVAIFMSLLFYINWTIICLAIMLTWYCYLVATTILGVQGALSGYSIFHTITICASTALLPLRISYVMDQVPYGSPNARAYFAVIVASWRLAELAFALYLLLGSIETAVRDVAVTITAILALYLAVLIILELTSLHDPQKGEWNNARKIFAGARDLKENEDSRRLWAILHIAMTLTSQTFAKYVTRLSMVEQMKSVTYFASQGTEMIISSMAHVVGLIAIILLETVVKPLMNRWNRQVTDLKLIGLGMIFGIMGLIVTCIIQEKLDSALRAPRRQEGLVFIFNILPDPTSFSSSLFGRKKSDDWMQLPGYRAVAWPVYDVVGRKEYECSVVNLNQSTWEETHIEVVEGAILSYVVTKKEVTEVYGLQLGATVQNHSLVYVGCATDVCVGHLYFHNDQGDIKTVRLPHKQNLTSVILRSGRYDITTFFISEEEFKLATNVVMKPDEMKTVFIYEREGDPAIQIFDTQIPEEFPMALYVVQAILIGLRDAFFDLGVFCFLFYETNPNKAGRPFVYSLFLFIFVGIPWLLLAGFRMAIFTILEVNTVKIGVLWYGCCFVLYVSYAYHYVHRTWEEAEG